MKAKWWKFNLKPLPKPLETEVLFDYTDVSGFRVKPWTLEKCELMAPVIAEITAKLKNDHLNFEDFFVKVGDEIEVINIERLIFICIPYLSRVFSITITGENDFNKLTQDQIVKLAAVILQQNMGYLKNLFALTATITAMLQEKTL